MPELWVNLSGINVEGLHKELKTSARKHALHGVGESQTFTCHTSRLGLKKN